MSAVLGKTFTYLAQSVNSAVAHVSGMDAAALWASPAVDSAPDAGLAPDTARCLESLARSPAGRVEAEAAAELLVKLDASFAPGASSSPPSPSASCDCLVRCLACRHAARGANIAPRFAKIQALQLAQRGSPLQRRMGTSESGLCSNENVLSWISRISGLLAVAAER